MKRDEKDRSARLLSKDVVPKIEVPRAPPPEPPKFKMPKSVSEPVAVLKAPVSKEPAPPTTPDEKAVPGPTRRRRRSTGTNFKDRTLSWFAAGEKQAAEAHAAAEQAAAEGGAAEDARPRGRGPVLAIALVAAALVATLLVWLVLRG